MSGTRSISQNNLLCSNQLNLIILAGENMFLRPLQFILITVFIMTCTACGSVQYMAPEQDSEAKQFKVADGKSNIYIYRYENVVFNTDISVDIDGQHAGVTNHKTYILQSVDPGKHTITAHAENIDELELTTEAGRNYFIWLEVNLGAVTNRAHLHSVSSQIGKAGVNECRLVK